MAATTQNDAPKQTNGVSKEGTKTPRPLNITIVGAGIGGLTAAIGLRRNGHNVTLFEQSRFASETGAAIQLCPNANGLLRRYGMNPEDFGSVTMRKLTEFTMQGAEKSQIDLSESSKLWQHPWQLSHRVRLHDKLKQVATSETGVGKPAALNVSSQVVEVDPETATIVLKNGEKIQADLILGADGIHSRTRVAVANHPGKLYSSGKAAFRFLIPREVALAVSGDAAIFQHHDQLGLWYADDRRVVVYPCDNNDLLNFVCIHPENESQGSAEEWNTPSTVEQVLKVYEGFDPRLLAVIKKADADSIKAWKLVDMEVLPSWVNGRLALLGDAAHPFLPHQGQGGGVAMEDAVALAVVLPSGTTLEEVPERLKLYEQIRYERGNAIQEYSRQAGKDHINGKPQVDMMKYVPYNFGHDEWDNSTKIFEAWQRKRNPSLYQGLPVGFGAPSALGQVTSSSTRAIIKIKTSQTFLQRLLPTEAFSFLSPASVAYASFQITSNTNLSDGTTRATIGLYIHGLKYEKKDGSVVKGSYLGLKFDHLADVVGSSKEDQGLAKFICDIKIQREARSYRAHASWRGANFASFALNGLQSATAEQSQDVGGNLLLYSYTPTASGDVGYPLSVSAKEKAKATTTETEGPSTTLEAKISFEPPTLESSPILHQVVTRLLELPVYEVVGASLSTEAGTGDLSSAQRIE